MGDHGDVVDRGALLALDVATLDDPYPLYAALRDDGPPTREPTYGVWLVARHADVLDVVRRPDVFSSIVAPSGPPPDLTGVPEHVRARLAAAPPPPRTLVTADPPTHTRYRAVLNRVLNVRRAEAWEPRIRQLAEELVDGSIGSGRCELVEEFAGPLPLRVVAELLGMPDATHDDLRRWADDAAVGIGNPQVVAERLRADRRSDADGFTDYFRACIVERRRAPVEGDLVSELVHARTPDGVLLDDGELLSILGHFLVAGHETSTKMITTAVLLLLQHPEQMAAVRADATLVANVVEEALRYDAPVQAMFRLATADTEVAGVPIAAGDMLMVLYGAGNRDAAQFEQPDRFDVHRPNARANLAFGQGAHYCAGAPFARAEGRLGLEVLLDRLDDLRLAPGSPPPARTASFILRGLRELHLEFTPASTRRRP
jgi:cytochrome P450